MLEKDCKKCVQAMLQNALDHHSSMSICSVSAGELGCGFSRVDPRLGSSSGSSGLQGMEDLEFYL